jgi:hypothetical protein
MSTKSQAWYDAMYTKKGRGTNQYTKAKELGVSLPAMSDKMRRKLAKYEEANPSS